MKTTCIKTKSKKRSPLGISPRNTKESINTHITPNATKNRHPNAFHQLHKNHVSTKISMNKTTISSGEKFMVKPSIPYR